MVLVGYMQDWINSSPDVIQTDSLLSINTNCEVVINSFNDSLCSCMMNNNTMSGTNETVIEDSGLLQTIIFIVSITVGVLYFILIFGLIVISVYRFKKKNKKRQ